MIAERVHVIIIVPIKAVCKSRRKGGFGELTGTVYLENVAVIGENFLVKLFAQPENV